MCATASGSGVYAYSADGMRQSKGTGSGTVHYVRDGENVLVETDGTLATVAQHTDLPGMWGGKYAQRRSGASRFPVPDFQGNTRALLDATASVTDTLTTDAWGVELARTGVTVDPFLAFGQWGYYRDAASRLYVRARHLRTDQGRWVSRDPIGFDGGDWNVYGYVRSQVVQHADPTGMQGPQIACMVAGAGTGAGAAVFIPGIGWAIGGVVVGAALLYGGYCLVRWLCRPKAVPRPLPPPPSPCTPKERAAYNAAVDVHCKWWKQSCNTQTRPCALMLVNAEAALDCYAARKLRDDRCFGGGNKEHKEEQQKALNNAMECLQLFASCHEPQRSRRMAQMDW